MVNNKSNKCDNTKHKYDKTKKYTGSKTSSHNHKKDKPQVEQLDDFLDIEKASSKQNKIKTEETDINIAKVITGKKISNNIFPDEIKTKEQELSFAKDFLEEHGITISTITLDCKLGSLININLFAKYLILKEDEIVSVKYGNRNNPATNRMIVVIPSKKKTKYKKLL
jgi:hypothetical protein